MRNVLPTSMFLFAAIVCLIGCKGTASQQAPAQSLDEIAFTLPPGTPIDLDPDSTAVQSVHVYDVRDLLLPPDKAAPPRFDLGTEQSAVKEPPADEDVAKAFMEKLQNAVAPNSWRDRGGKVGTMRLLNGSLVVNQTGKNQRAIDKLLRHVREIRSIDIAIESMMILVDEASYQKIASIVPADAKGGSKGSPEFISSAVTDKQLRKIMFEIQSSPDSASLSFPRVVLHNGQRGYCACTEQQNFISGIEKKHNAAGQLETVRQISTLTTGARIELEPTASADRRHIAVRSRPSLSHLEALDDYRSPDNPEEVVQLPRIRFTSVDTLTSVPDGQSWLHGGEIVIGPLDVPTLSGFGTSVSTNESEKVQRRLIVIIRPKMIPPNPQ